MYSQAYQNRDADAIDKRSFIVMNWHGDLVYMDAGCFFAINESGV